MQTFTMVRAKRQLMLPNSQMTTNFILSEVREPRQACQSLWWPSILIILAVWMKISRQVQAILSKLLISRSWRSHWRTMARKILSFQKTYYSRRLTCIKKCKQLAYLTKKLSLDSLRPFAFTLTGISFQMSALASHFTRTSWCSSTQPQASCMSFSSTTWTKSCQDRRHCLALEMNSHHSLLN